MTPDPRHGLLLQRWGGFVTRHPRSIVGSWLAFIVVGFVLALGVAGTPGLFDRLHSGEIVVPGENADGRALLDRGGSTGFSTYILTVEGADLTDPAVAQAAAQAAADITSIDRVASAANPFAVPGGPTGPAAAPLLGEGGVASGDFAMVVTYAADDTTEQEVAAEAKVDEVMDRLVAQVRPESSQRGGIRSLVDAIVGQVKKDGQRGEGIALPVSFVVMVVRLRRLPRGRAPDARRDRVDRRCAGLPPRLLLPHRARRLRRQRRHRPRARALHRLRTARRLPLPGGAAARARSLGAGHGATEPSCTARMPGDRTSGARP